MKKNKILAIPGVFVPYNDTITLMTYKHLREIKNTSIDVITLESQKDESLDALLKKEKAFKNLNIEYVKGKWKDTFVNSGNLNFMKSIFLISKYWIVTFNKGIKGKYDFVYSNSVPNYTHVAAYLIKRKKKNIKWIASFSDPIVGNIYVKNMKRKNIFTKDMVAYFFQKMLHYRKFYQNCALKHADYLLFISEELRDFVTKKDPKLIKKSIIYPITYIKEWDMYKNLSDMKEIKPKNNKVIKYMHFGNIYGLRNIYSLVDALKLLKKENPKEYKKIKICQYGHIDTLQVNYIRDKKVEDVFEIHEKVDYDKCLSLMKNDANVLLLLDTIVKENEEQPFLPSKIIEYLLTRKPIFSITTRNSPAYKILFKKHICSLPKAQEIMNSLLMQNKDISLKNNDIDMYENKNAYKNNLERIIEE